MPTILHALPRRLVCLTMMTVVIATPRPEAAQGSAADAVRQASQLMDNGKTGEAVRRLLREDDAESSSLAVAGLLDVLGETGGARRIIQRAIDAAPNAAVRAAVQRVMAVSYAFAGDCANATRYEERVVAYWVTRESAEPQNAFFQQGEVANEAGRICIDAGDLEAAERHYRRGAELGLKEPGNRAHPKSLWDYRLAHALGRIAARRGNEAEAQRQIAAARSALDSDSAMAGAQERFFPYLVGYVALYTNDLQTAEAELTKALAIGGNEADPFMHALLGMTYEKAGNAAKARELFQRAYALSTEHTVPSAFTRPFARTKLGLKK
jgi:tetratricopeptide (TPR) repeat protein